MVSAGSVLVFRRIFAVVPDMEKSRFYHDRFAVALPVSFQAAGRIFRLLLFDAIADFFHSRILFRPVQTGFDQTSENRFMSDRRPD